MNTHQLALVALWLTVSLPTPRVLAQLTNPWPGRLSTGGTNALGPRAMESAEFEAVREVQRLVALHRPEAALQCCLAFHERWQTNGSMFRLIPVWVELGRGYPKAQTALLGIRDRNARELLAGRGYFRLFQEVSAINRAFHQEEATYALFKSLREKDPGVARQCYSLMEDALVAKGQYEWCYEYIGDAQERFEAIQQALRLELERVQRLTKLHEQGVMGKGSGMAELLPKAAQSARERFVHQSGQLIEILVATEHREDAAKIRQQAVTVLDDPRLQSAMADAEARLHKPSNPGRQR